MLSNATLPQRVRLEPVRELFGNITTLPGSVHALGRGVYAVANKVARARLQGGGECDAGDAALFHAVDIFRDVCPCDDAAAHCAHVLAARWYHAAVLKLPRVWLDAELSLVFPDELPSTLESAAVMRELLVDGAEAQPSVLVSPAELNASAAEMSTAIISAMGAANSYMRRAPAAAEALQPLAADAPPGEVTDRHAQLRRGAALVKAINGVTAAAAAC